MKDKPLTEIEFYLKRLEACVRAQPERYSLSYVVVNKNTKDCKECRCGSADDLLIQESYLLERTMLDVIKHADMSDNDRVQFIANICMTITETVSDFYSKSKEE